MSDLPVTLEYELTRDDLYAFQWRAAFQSPRGRRIRRWSYVGWLLAIVLFAIVPAIGPGGLDLSQVSFTFILIAFPIVALCQWFFETRLMRRLINRLLDEEKPERGQLGGHRVTLTEDGILERTAVNEQRTSWAGVDRVEQNADYIFIYTSPAAAHMIPRRAFPNTREAEAFYQLALTRKAAAP
jgi:YcxB-like protein